MYSFRARSRNPSTVDRIDIIRSDGTYTAGLLCLSWNGFAIAHRSFQRNSHRLVQKPRYVSSWSLSSLIRESIGAWCRSPVKGRLRNFNASSDWYSYWISMIIRHTLLYMHIIYYRSMVNTRNRLAVIKSNPFVIIGMSNILWRFTIIIMHLVRVKTWKNKVLWFIIFKIEKTDLKPPK